MKKIGGIGLGFVADVAGAVSGIKLLKKTTSGLGVTMGAISGASSKFSSSVAAGINGAQRSLAGVARSSSSVIQQMIDDASSPKLDHAYSSMYADFDKTFSAMTAGMKMTSTEAKKMQRIIGSAAFGLNEDMDESAKSWKAFEQVGIDLTQVMGAKNLKGAMKNLIRVTSVYGTEGQQLANVMGGLVKGFGFTEAGVSSLSDKIAYVGREFNMGTEAIQAWPAIFEAMNSEFADFGREMSAADIDKMTVSVIKLGGGLKNALGLDANTAIEVSKNLFTTLAQERKNVLKMAKGMEGEFGDVTSELFKVGANAGDVFENLLAGDPLRFMDFMREMGKQAESQGGKAGAAFQRLSTVLNEAIDPNIAYVAKGSWDKVKDSVAAINPAAEEAKGAFVRLAKEGHRTGLTAQDGWDRAVEGMKAKLYELSRKDMKGWVENMKSGFNQTYNTIESVAKDDGPIGEFTRKLLLAERVGLSAFIPSLGRLGPMFNGLAQQMVPAMTALGSMGLTFGRLGKLAIGGGLIAGLVHLKKNGLDKTVNDVKTFAKDIWNDLGELFPEIQANIIKFKDYIVKGGFIKDIQSAFNSVNWDNVIDNINGFAKGTWDVIKSLAKSAVDFISDIDYKKNFKTIVESMFETIGNIDFQSIIGGIGTGLGKIVKTVGQMLGSLDWGKILGNLVDATFSILGGLKDAVFNFFGVFGEKNTQDVAQAGVTDLFMGLGVFVKDIGKKVFQGIYSYIFDVDNAGEAFGRIAKGLALGLGGALIAFKGFRGKFLGAVKGFMGKLRNTMAMGRGGIVAGVKGTMKSIGSVMRGAGKMIGGFALFAGALEAMDQFKQKGQEIADIMEHDVVESSKKAQMSGERAFVGILETVNAATLGIPEMIGNSLGFTSNEVRRSYHFMVADAEKAMHTVGGYISYFIDNIKINFEFVKSLISNTWETSMLSAEFAFKRIKLYATEAFNSIGQVFDDMKTGVYKAFKNVSFTIEEVFIKIMTGIMKQVAKLGNIPMFSSLAKGAKTYLEEDNLSRLEKERREFNRIIELGSEERKKQRLLEEYKARGDLLGTRKQYKDALQKNDLAVVDYKRKLNNARLDRDKTISAMHASVDDSVDANIKQSEVYQDSIASKTEKITPKAEEEAVKDEKKKKYKRRTASGIDSAKIASKELGDIIGKHVEAALARVGIDKNQPVNIIIEGDMKKLIKAAIKEEHKSARSALAR